MAIKTVTRRDAVEMIRARKDFKIGTGSMTGRYTVTWDGSDYGHLPEKYQKAWSEAVLLHAYAVWSYSTPILWILPSGEVVEPPVKYSMTTSHHQAYARRGAHT